MIQEIKSKYNVSDEFVKYLLNYYLKRHKVNLKKKSGRKKVIKNVRAILHKLIGQYKTKKYHKSILERDYSGLYEKIFSITGEVKSILDIGCGLNPLTLKNYQYYAYDIDKDVLSKVKKHFKKNNIKSEVKEKNFFVDFKYPKADVCFLFKVLRLIDFKGHKNAEKILKSLDVKWIVASFATKTISGRRMNYPRVGWFEILLKRLKWKYEKFYWQNESFYVIGKAL